MQCNTTRRDTEQRLFPLPTRRAALHDEDAYAYEFEFECALRAGSDRRAPMRSRSRVESSRGSSTGPLGIRLVEEDVTRGAARLGSATASSSTSTRVLVLLLRQGHYAVCVCRWRYVNRIESNRVIDPTHECCRQYRTLRVQNHLQHVAAAHTSKPSLIRAQDKTSDE